MSNTIRGEWVVGYYTGAQAQHVAAQGHAGIGYFVLEEGGTKMKPEVRAAFRRAIDGPLPPHLDRVTDPAKIRQYNKMFDDRNGIHDSEEVSDLGVRS